MGEAVEMESTGQDQIGDRESRYCEITWRLFVLLESRSQMDAGDARLLEARQAFFDSIQTTLDSEPGLLIQARHGFLFLNGQRIPVASGAFAAVQYVVSQFFHCGLAGLMFAQGLRLEELVLLEEALIEGRSIQDSEVWQQLTSVQPMPEDPFLAELNLGDADGRPETYLTSVFLVRNLFDCFQRDGMVGAAVAKSILQQMVDVLLRERDLLTWMRDCAMRDEEQICHAVNTSVIAVLIGAHIGMPQSLLEQLGVGALFHDLGRLPGEEDEAETDGRPGLDHGVRGMRRLVLAEPELSDLVLRTMAVCCEHHTGAGGVQRPLLTSHIVALAERFDRLHRQHSELSAAELVDMLQAEAEQGAWPEALVGGLRRALEVEDEPSSPLATSRG